MKSKTDSRQRGMNRQTGQTSGDPYINAKIVKVLGTENQTKKRRRTSMTIDTDGVPETKTDGDPGIKKR
jgi:hypothetical protein